MAETDSALRLFKTWFWRPPRAHGDTIVDRRVSPLELLYDLVYVAVISQAGHHLAGHVTPVDVADFAVVLSVTWLAWINGSLYLELHGRPDGRTRTYVFVQMGILAVLAVFAGDIAGGSGAPFAITYAVFLAVTTWLWYTVRRQDVIERPEFLPDTGRYVITMAVSVAVMAASAFLPAQARVLVWALTVAGWVVLLALMGRVRIGLAAGITPTESLVERFGTFTIIVLGEVVFGVVTGLSVAVHDLKTIATGMVALAVGFGFWWIYFDLVGGRLPKRDGRALANWLLSHLPVALSIAGAGAGMVSLLANAEAERTPAATAWLLSGAVAVGLGALILTSRALADADRFAAAYRPLEVAMGAGAVASVVVGFTRPAPWLLALLLVLVLGLVWAVAVRGFLIAGAWNVELPEHR